MKKLEGVFYLVICFTVLAAMTGLSYADNAEVLPKGVFRATVNSKFYLPIDERFNPEGDVESAAFDYNTTLDSMVFPALGMIESAFGMPAGSANVGDSVAAFEYDVDIVDIGLAYGLTDKLTVGITIPYFWVKNTVTREIDTTSATVGLNPFFGSPADPFLGSPLVPIALGGIPLTTEQVIELLRDGLDIDGDGSADIQGFGYEDFTTWSHNDVGDIDVGARYQYLKNDNWQLAATGGVRIPTGYIDNKDNLVDNKFGNGVYALFLHLNNDYTGIENMVLNATIRYDLILPADEVLRVPDDVDRPISMNKEEVERNLGDVIELEASAKYTFLKTLTAGLTYKYGHAFKTQVTGDMGFAYESLENETDYTEHVLIVGLSYSTIPLYMEKKFPIPFKASVSYRNRFAGSNNVFKSQYISAGLGIYF